MKKDCSFSYVKQETVALLYKKFQIFIFIFLTSHFVFMIIVLLSLETDIKKPRKAILNIAFTRNKK